VYFSVSVAEGTGMALLGGILLLVAISLIMGAQNLSETYTLLSTL